MAGPLSVPTTGRCRLELSAVRGLCSVTCRPCRRCRPGPGGGRGRVDGRGHVGRRGRVDGWGR